MAVLSPEMFHQFDPEVISDRLQYIGAGLLAATTVLMYGASRVAIRLGAEEATSEIDPILEMTEEDALTDTLEEL